MKVRHYLPLAGIASVIVALLFVTPFNRTLYSSEPADDTFTHILSTGDQVALDTLPEGTRIVVAPDEAYWRDSQRQGDGLERGVITDIYDDYVSIRIVNEGTIDPLLPQGMTRIVHLPIPAIARVVTFVERK
jgi:hypothetical protein